jgi:hypothetical protein
MAVVLSRASTTSPENHIAYVRNTEFFPAMDTPAFVNLDTPWMKRATVRVSFFLRSSWEDAKNRTARFFWRIRKIIFQIGMKFNFPFSCPVQYPRLATVERLRVVLRRLHNQTPKFELR